MLRLDWTLKEMLVSASEEARTTRNAIGITTMDLMKELIEDAESVLYSYMIESSPDEEIEFQLSNAMMGVAARKDLKYDIPYRIIRKNKDEVQVFFTSELYQYLKAAEKIIWQEDQVTYVNPIDVMTAIFEKPTKEITKFLRSLRVDIPEVREMLELNYLKEEEPSQIPESMQGYLSIISGDITVSGRDKEIDAIWNILLKRTKRNAILIGDQGVGKTAIIKKIVSQIKSKTAPEEFNGFCVYSLDVNSVISGTKYRGDAELRFKELIDFIKNRKNAILFIDEAHMLMGAGTAEGHKNDMANALKPVLSGEESRVIAATTKAEYEKYFSKDPAFKRRFEKVEVDEPRIDEVYPMIKAKIQALSKYHKVKITRQMVDFIALYASCFNSETKNPDRTLDLIDRSMVTAKRRKKEFVDKESVLANFKVDMDCFQSMSISDRTATAYHEAGHYIAYTFLPYMSQRRKTIVVSIYPTNQYLGVTCTEERKNVYVTRDKEAYLEEIAVYLAGGIAEKIVNSKENDGVSSDSQKATEMARLLITKTGFFNDFFYQLDSFNTEKSLEAQVEKIKQILSEAKIIAQNVIESHKKELEAVVAALLRDKVLSDAQLKEVMKNACKKGKEGVTSYTK